MGGLVGWGGVDGTAMMVGGIKKATVFVVALLTGGVCLATEYTFDVYRSEDTRGKFFVPFSVQMVHYTFVLAWLCLFVVFGIGIVRNVPVLWNGFVGNPVLALPVDYTS